MEQDFSDDFTSECESDDNDAESGEECTSESEVEDGHDVSNEEEWSSSAEANVDGSDKDEVDVQATAEAVLKKLIPYNLADFGKVLYFGGFDIVYWSYLRSLKCTWHYSLKYYHVSIILQLT